MEKPQAKCKNCYHSGLVLKGDTIVGIHCYYENIKRPTTPNNKCTKHIYTEDVVTELKEDIKKTIEISNL